MSAGLAHSGRTALSSRTLVASAAVLALAYATALWALSGFHVTTDDFSRAGPALVLYNTARCVFLALCLLGMLSAGALLQRRLAPNAAASALGCAAYLVAVGFLGFSVLSLLFFVAGFAQLYRYWIVSLGLGALVAACPWTMHEWTALAPGRLRSVMRDNGPYGRAAFLAVSSMLLFAATALLLLRGLYIGERDNDVWEHYLHYYQAVVSNAGIQPNDLWIHFFVSKAAGLFFAAAVVSDVFAPQLISWLVILLASVAVYDIVSEGSGNRLAGISAGAVMLAAWCAVSGEAGSLLKHHTVVAALIIAVFWCTTRAAESSAPETRRLLLVSGAACAFYLGVHITVAGAVLIAGLCAYALISIPMRRRFASIVCAIFCAACASGMATAMAINYGMTGLLLDSPTSVFWPLVDRARFSQVWSPLVVEYWFVGPASRSDPVSLTAFFHLHADWWAQLLRIPYLKTCLWAALAVAVSGALAISTARRRNPASPAISHARFLVAAIAFTIGTMAVAQLFPGSESVFRLYSFCVAFVVAVVAMALGLLLSRARANSEVLANALIAVWCFVGVTSLVAQVPKDWRRSAVEFAAGRISLQQAIRTSETSFGERATTASILQFRSETGIRSNIMFLTYDAAPAYFLPSPPAMSEPSYAFGRDYGDLLYGGDTRAREILRARDVGAFVINLRNRLFLGLPYSPLFSAGSLQKYFALAWRSGDLIFLRWRRSGDPELDPELVRILQAKRTGAIPADADLKWGKELASALRDGRRAYDQGSMYYGWLYEAMRERYRDP